MANTGPDRQMQAINYTNAVQRRNEYRHHPELATELLQLTRGGRLIQQRTRWSTSLSNAVAAAVGIGTNPMER